MSQRKKLSLLLVAVVVLWVLAIVISPYFPLGPTKCHNGVMYFSKFNSNPTPVYNQDGTLSTCQE